LDSETVRLDLKALLEALYKLREDIDSYIDTLEILLDKELMEELKESEEDIKKGNIITHEELKRKYKL